MAYIRDLWNAYTEGRGTDASLGKWLEGRFQVSSLRFLDKHMARKVIGALRTMNGKRMKGGGKADRPAPAA